MQEQVPNKKEKEKVLYTRKNVKNAYGEQYSERVPSVSTDDEILMKTCAHNKLLKSCILCSPFPFQHCPNNGCTFFTRDPQLYTKHCNEQHVKRAKIVKTKMTYTCSFPFCVYKTIVYADMRKHNTKHVKGKKTSEEFSIEQFLVSNEIEHIFQRVIDTYTTDFFLPREKGTILLEIDEQQHRKCSCTEEINRMIEIYNSLQHKGPVLIIRYNPHIFHADKRVVELSEEDRQKQLLQMIQTEQFTQPLTVVYMFYDTINGKPRICNNLTYSNSFKQYVRF